MRSRSALPVLLLLISATLAAGEEPLSTLAPTEAEHVIGFGNIKKNTKGTLELKNGFLFFISDSRSFDIRADSIHEVVTGNDTQRAIGGTVGTISQLAPYGAGRALSLLRDKIDTLTIEYRDSDGGLHGAVFTMPVGKAESLKKELLTEGAQSTIPVKKDLAESNSQSQAEERQP